MNTNDYRSDPCRASSLPFWKTEHLVLPESIGIFREDEYDSAICPGLDEPYFRLRHDLTRIPDLALPKDTGLVSCDAQGYAEHICEGYTQVRISAAELAAYPSHPVYDPSLWIAVGDRASGRVVATGIGELDDRIGEGILEWIQVSPGFRRKGLGAFVVCELLRRMRGRAAFATVSGRVRNETHPFDLYRFCGFTDPVIWHVVRRT